MYVRVFIKIVFQVNVAKKFCTNWFKPDQTVFIISNFCLHVSNFTVVIPIKMSNGQKFLSQIWQSKLLIAHYSEITEPGNVFGMQPTYNLETGNMAQSLGLQH